MKGLKKILACVACMTLVLTGCGLQEKEEVKIVLAQDEVGTYKGVEYSVVSVEKNTGVEDEIPKEGYEYVVVTVKIENKSREKISYNPYDWKMENSQGQESNEAFVVFNNDTHLNSGDLRRGDVVSGTMVFEQPAQDDGLILHYYQNSFFDHEPSISFIIQ